MKTPPSMLTAPWLITEDGANLVWAVWSRGEMFRDHLEAVRADRPGPYANASGSLCVEDGVAVIQVTGPIFRKAGLMSELSGATTDEQLRASLGRAVADPSVRAIVLEFDSPGGEAAGAAETSAAIRAADKAKPVLGYIPSLAASKAYWFASACRELVIAPDALVGCIGARKGMLDDSAADKAMGVVYIDLVNDASPAKRSWPIDEAVIAEAKRELNDIAAVFIEDVGLGRGVAPEAVVANFGRGGVLVGAKAVTAKMADIVGTRGEALERARSAGRTAASRTTMTMSTGAGANADNMECNDCSKGLAGNDPIYCSSCAGKTQEASAAMKFRADLFASLGVTTEAEALGKITAGVTAAKELPGIVAERDELRAVGLKRDLRAVLTEGFSSGRLTLGRATSQLPVALRGVAKTQWKAGCEAMTEQSQDAFLAAVEGVQLNADDLAALRESIAAFQPVAAAPAPEKPRDAKAEATALSLDEARAREIDARMGIKPDTSTSAAK